MRTTYIPECCLTHMLSTVTHEIGWVSEEKHFTLLAQTFFRPDAYSGSQQWIRKLQS